MRIEYKETVNPFFLKKDDIFRFLCSNKKMIVLNILDLTNDICMIHDTEDTIFIEYVEVSNFMKIKDSKYFDVNNLNFVERII